MVVGPMLALCPSRFDRVLEANIPQGMLPVSNLCSQVVLDMDGMFAIPHVIIDSSPSVSPSNCQLDDRPPADAEVIDSLAPSSTPSPHSGFADQLRKASSTVCYDRRLSSFAKVLSRGLVADSVGLSGAGCDAAAVDLVPPCLPPEQGSVVDTAVEPSISPLDAQVSHHDLSTAIKVDLNNTPNSISRLSRKYSLDTSSIMGFDSSSPSDSLPDIRVGQTPVVSRVKYYSTNEFCAEGAVAGKGARSILLHCEDWLLLLGMHHLFMAVPDAGEQVTLKWCWSKFSVDAEANPVSMVTHCVAIC
ncbi:hypothetical protein Nepgr_026011 [Nepenthes gracilis]|uniref:Uncharacterized protein n=1 Tax=Nepenthes gracilis TaxID=150966 RepID=A0AAD3T621_NEPGR|nr:hypothetical protein Nepgr_026011 [Nepenthes gracilis]